MLDPVSRKGGFIPRDISREQAKDTGMAAVLVCLILTQITQKQYLMVIAIILLLGNMVWPDLYRPVAKLWLGFSHFLGTYMSKLILAIIFTVLVIPVGVVRRIAGVDSLQLKKWKNDSVSVFTVRDHIYRSDDIEKPY